MARKQNNTFAVLIWVFGLLACIGYIYPLGFLGLLIPLLFWLFGSKFTKSHCEAYFNVLITGVIIHLLGTVISKLLSWINIHIFELKYIGLIYFALLCIFGLFKALNNKHYRPELVFKIF